MKTRKLRQRKLTRARVRAFAPREPRSAMLEYTRFVRRIVASLRSIIEDAANLAPGFVPKTDQRTDATDQEKLRAIRTRMLQAVEERKLRVGLERVAENIWGHSSREMGRILAIDLRRQPGLEAFSKRFVRENVELIQRMTTRQYDRIERVVSRGVVEGMRVETLRDRILETADVTESRAMLIARDQTLKHNSQLSEERQKAAGVSQYVWSTSNDERVRGRPGGEWADSDSDHWSLDGRTFSWSDPPVTNPVTGERNHPGFDFQCRCVAVPLTDQLLFG